jgi:IS605 OrfB family transposase
MPMKVYKTEINPTIEQAEKILRTIGVCRFVYNLFIATNKERHGAGLKYMGGYEFSKWLNNEYRLLHPEHYWIWEVSSKAVKDAIMNADKAFRRFFKEKKGYPGIEKMAVISNGTVYRNINKSSKIRKLKKKLRREQRRFSRKIQNRKKVNAATGKSANLNKQRIKVQTTYYRLDSVRKDYINKTVSELVKTKPVSITLEDLNVRGMLKNRHLSAAISEQNFHYFKTRMEAKCKENGIELRIADRFFPSSKLCSSCQSQQDLKLKDRVFKCPVCGLEIDRDLNAAINLKHCKVYKVA